MAALMAPDGILYSIKLYDMKPPARRPLHFDIIPQTSDYILDTMPCKIPVHIDITPHIYLLIVDLISGRI